MPTTLTPMLTVKDSAAAVDFCTRAFGATQGVRHVAPNGQAVIQLWIEGHELYVVDEDPGGFNLSPATLGGTSVRLSLVVDDPDALFARAVAAGATVIFPLADHSYGLRQGRVADPSGHHWLIGKRLAR